MPGCLRRVALVLTATTLVAVAACSAGAAAPPPARPAGAVAPSAAGPSASQVSNGGHRATRHAHQVSGTSRSAQESAVAARVSKLMVIVLENRSAGEALRQMPHLAAQAHRYGIAEHWYAVAHPSLPNYLELVGGSTFGVRDDNPPSRHRLHGPSVFGQLTAHGRSAVTYAQRLPAPCYQTNSGRYLVRHNPATYFVDNRERAACLAHNLRLGGLARGPLHDAVTQGRLPTYSMLIPDRCNDGHDCSLAHVDPWLDAWMRFIESGPDFRRGRLALVVTFDEDDHSAGNHVLTVVAAAQLRQRVVTKHFTHASLAAAPSRLAGLSPLRGAQGSPDVLHAFGLR